MHSLDNCLSKSFSTLLGPLDTLLQSRFCSSQTALRGVTNWTSSHYPLPSPNSSLLSIWPTELPFKPRLEWVVPDPHPPWLLMVQNLVQTPWHFTKVLWPLSVPLHALLLLRYRILKCWCLIEVELLARLCSLPSAGSDAVRLHLCTRTEQEQHFSNLFGAACSLTAATPAHTWQIDTSMTTVPSSA